MEAYDESKLNEINLLKSKIECWIEWWKRHEGAIEKIP